MPQNREPLVSLNGRPSTIRDGSYNTKTRIRSALSLMVLFSIPSIALPQGMTPPNGLAGPSPNDNGVPLLLRIPATWIAKSVNRDFEHNAPVNQVILGTTSSGNTYCKGQVTCSIMDNPTGVSILCSIDGTVNSVTCGANGPATISSESVTLYHSTKNLTFDGKRFASNPASLSSCTQVTITGVGSSLPGLRGILNAGGTWLDEPCVSDEGLITSRSPADLPIFCEMAIKEFAKGMPAVQPELTGTAL
jgi:hypothetical protein